MPCWISAYGLLMWICHKQQLCSRLILLVQLWWLQSSPEPPVPAAANLNAQPWHTWPQWPWGHWHIALVATNPERAAKRPSSAKHLLFQKLRSALLSPCVWWTKVNGLKRDKSNIHLQGFGMWLMEAFHILHFYFYAQHGSNWTVMCLHADIRTSLAPNTRSTPMVEALVK